MRLGSTSGVARSDFFYTNHLYDAAMRLSGAHLIVRVPEPLIPEITFREKSALFGENREFILGILGFEKCRPFF